MHQMNPFVGGNRTTDKLIKVFFLKAALFFYQRKLLLRLSFAQLETEGAVCEEGM